MYGIQAHNTQLKGETARWDLIFLWLSKVLEGNRQSNEWNMKLYE